jgi:hypothetical protein
MADGLWRMAPGGRPLEDGPWRTAQAEGSAMAVRPAETLEPHNY